MVVGRRGGADDGVYGERVGARLLEQLFYGLASHVACAQAFFVENATFLDANTCHYPFIRGIDHPTELVVGEHIIGHIASDTGNDSV